MLKGDPSFSKLSSLTQIEISGSKMTSVSEELWNTDPVFPLPPLFSEYCILIGDDSDSKDKTDIMIYCRYDSVSDVHLVHYVNGKKWYSVDIDFNTLEDDDDNGSKSVSYYVDWLKNNQVEQELLEELSLYTIMSWGCVSYYILTFRSDVEQEIIKSKKTSKNKTKSKQSNTIYIRSKKKKYVITDEEIVPKQKKYRAMCWNVRGHFRSRSSADGSSKLIYVKPHIAKRKKGTASAEIVENKKYKINNE